MERLGGDEAFGVYAHAPGPFKAFLAFMAGEGYHAALAALAGAARESRTKGRPA